MKAWILLWLPLILTTQGAPRGLAIELKPPYHQVSVSPSSNDGELEIGVTHTIWIPEGVETIRGIIVHQHGCGKSACKGGETAAFDLHWQALAQKWDCALLGPSYQQTEEQNCRLWCDPRNGSEKVFLEALKELGEKSGHPELSSAPWCLWGHSGGGFWASLMQMAHPDQIIAIWFQSETAFGYQESDDIEIPEAAMHIPMMANSGVEERDHERFRKAWDGTLALFKSYRARGAPIAFTPDPLTGQEAGDSRYLAIPFFDACLAQRLPDQIGQPLKAVDESSAWLATPLTNEVNAAPDYAGNPKDACWFPNETVARAWSEFVQKGTVGDSTPPPAPTRVIARPAFDGGVDLIWQAKADFESGLGGFLVRRDGEEIGRLPEESKKRFGRPLFQAMSFHDNPETPLPKMYFLDLEGTLDSHYEIIAINSVGLESPPTPAKTPPSAK